MNAKRIVSPSLIAARSSKRTLRALLALASVALGGSACTQEVGSASAGDSEGALTTKVAEAAGTNCRYGGELVQTGIDANHDGVLEATEVTSHSYICNGSTEDRIQAAMLATAATGPAALVLNFAVAGAVNLQVEAFAIQFTHPYVASSGVMSGAPAISGLDVQVVASAEDAILMQAAATAQKINSFTLTGGTSAGSTAPLQLLGTNASVTEADIGATNGTLSSHFLLHVGGISVVTSSGTAGLSAAGAACSGSACAATPLGPYVAGSPSWALPAGAVRTSTISGVGLTVPTSSTGTPSGAPQLAPLSIGGPLEPSIAFATGALLAGTSLGVTTVESQVLPSATGQILIGEKIDACGGSFVSNVQLTGGLTTMQEQLSLVMSGFGLSSTTFASGGVATQTLTSSVAGPSGKTCS